jgi:SepF-like predicted cell division protein (DUF552 family)
MSSFLVSTFGGFIAQTTGNSLIVTPHAIGTFIPRTIVISKVIVVAML